MYEVDDKDLVVELRDAPRPDAGAPIPVVVCDEHRLFVAYRMSDPDPNWDGTYVTIVYPDSQGTVALVKFKWPYTHMFGPPNDEAFEGHPLESRGLHPYGVFEIQDSSWIRQLERMNSVHPYHNKQRFLERRHFIITFHDSTFECIAAGFETEVFRGFDSIRTWSYGYSLAGKVVTDW